MSSNAAAEDGQVRAAGGVPVRTSADGTLEVLIVTRVKYDDWSFPKGKLDPGEHWKDAARREVREETGLTVELGPELSPASYLDHRDRPKRVRYWLMHVVDDDGFDANDEIAAIRWLPLDVARTRVTYEHDRLLCREVEQLHESGGS